MHRDEVNHTVGQAGSRKSDAPCGGNVASRRNLKNPGAGGAGLQPEQVAGLCREGPGYSSLLVRRVGVSPTRR